MGAWLNPRPWATDCTIKTVSSGCQSGRCRSDDVKLRAKAKELEAVERGVIRDKREPTSIYADHLHTQPNVQLWSKMPFDEQG
jgi:hypothetical protein